MLRSSEPTSPARPSVGADNFGASVIAGKYLGTISKKRFPDEVPYAVVAAEPSAGAIVMQRYHGAVAGVKKVFPNLPSDHVIQVKSDGTETGTYNNAVSALSRIPSDGVVLMTGVNDEVVHGMYKAAKARHIKNYLVNSFGGDPFGLAQVCADRTHYIGALYLLPETWGSSALAVILRRSTGRRSRRSSASRASRSRPPPRRPAASSQARRRLIETAPVGGGRACCRPPRTVSGRLAALRDDQTLCSYPAHTMKDRSEPSKVAT